MKTLRFILGDQLSHSISSLEGVDRQEDVVFMCEVHDEAIYVKHHKKKIAFLFSAMRHFAAELRDKNFKVDYLHLDDEKSHTSFTSALGNAIAQHNPDRVIVTHPGEYRVLKDLEAFAADSSIPIEIVDDTRFLCSIDHFHKWAEGRKSLRMEYFYREMRRKYHILMDGDHPEGGAWNYDSENRKPPKEDLSVPEAEGFEPDAITREVLDLVANRFSAHFGDLEPFDLAVTRKQALTVLRRFISDKLPLFGDFQDAMVQGEPIMFHAKISFYLNCGLLNPKECIAAAEQAYHDGQTPLNAAEGFIRQILGWREYVRGVYWLNMPDYAHTNYLEANRKLPSFYWTGETKLNCLRQCVLETKQNAYAHHIQRLMVLGNFALLAGIHPDEVNEWYLLVYADAYEWVEMPNVTGMILYADGGYLASKPYAAGGSYINKMSDYCSQCSYKVTVKNGPKACPFNYLYWDFMMRNREKLESNHRVGMMMKTLDRMGDQKRDAIRDDTKRFFREIGI